MVTFYLCFLAGGAVLPFLSAILGTLSGNTDTDLDVSTDTDLDVSVDTDLDVSADTEIDVSVDSDLDVSVDTDLNLDPTLDNGVDLDADQSVDAYTNGISAGNEVGSALTIGFLPTSLMALSALAVTFGAVGSIMTLTGKGRIISFVVSVIAGYLASVIVQSIIKTLKNIQKRNYGINENELLMYDGKVIDTILPGQLGTVSFTTLKDIHVSYPARCAQENLKLVQGRVVKVLELKNGVVIVEPKNKYE